MPTAKQGPPVIDDAPKRAAAKAKEPEAVNPVPKGLHKKLSEILGSLDGLVPSGRNAHFKYDYWEATQVTGIFRSRFAEHGLTFMSDVVDYEIRDGKTAKGAHTWLMTMRVLFTITDMETGEFVSGHGLGQGDDPGDKGSNKAFAGALKYWLLKTFLMGGEDAEADEETDRRNVSRDDEPDPIIEPSNIEGVQRGGRSSNANEVQVKKVRKLAGELKLSMGDLLETIKMVHDVDTGIDPGEEGAGAKLVAYLNSLSADSIGNLIQYMEAMETDG